MTLRLGAAALGVAVALLATVSAWADAVPVRVGVIPVLGASAIFVADGEGILKKNGITPSFKTFESGPNMLQALASGTLDVYVAGIGPLAVARSKGIDVKVVASTAIEEMVFVAGPRLAGFFGDGVKPADAFGAFHKEGGKPARLATQPPGSVPNTTLQHWLWAATGTAKADADIVAMGIDATQQAILTGAVDGASIREPALTIVQARNPAIKLIALGDAMFPNQPGTVVAVSGAFASAHPDAVQGLVEALVQATDILRKDPDKAAPDVLAALGKGITDVATIRRALTSPASKFVVDPHVIIDATRAMQSYQVSIGTLDKDVPIDGLFETRFYDKAAGK